MRNILVCGNGPSCTKIDFTRVPDDVKIMRATSFYFEDKYYAGKRVDYYVDYMKRIVNQYFVVRTVHDKGEYDIDLANTWWTVMHEKNPHFPAAKSCTDYIQQNIYIAEFRCFYEYYYGQYLPTGMQALALAFCLGYENIYVAGFDMFTDPNNMHPFPYGGKVMQAALESVPSTGIYDTSEVKSENKSEFEYVQVLRPTDMQVKFVQLLQKCFPKTKIMSVVENSIMNQHVTVAPIIHDVPWYVPQKKPTDRTTDWYPLPESMPSRRRNTQ
ncbi:MAG: hypothetical protein FWB88_00875 [Defluviitaleaceae bacterium]|nr:hypothetical protein [Defluviitaleaceae bacterium]MCL2238349.1 hypothetical protein [Defluviitaleaceae bacterium]